MTTITDTPAETIPARQSRAARVLVDLLDAEHLPHVSWRVDDTSPGNLTGQIHRMDEGHLIPGLVAKWAEVFGVEVRTYRSRADYTPPFIRHWMRTHLDGVTVEVWGLVNVTDDEKDAA